MRAFRGSSAIVFSLSHTRLASQKEEVRLTPDRSALLRSACTRLASLRHAPPRPAVGFVSPVAREKSHSPVWYRWIRAWTFIRLLKWKRGELTPPRSIWCRATAASARKRKLDRDTSATASVEAAGKLCTDAWPSYQRMGDQSSTRKVLPDRIAWSVRHLAGVWRSRSRQSFCTSGR